MTNPLQTARQRIEAPASVPYRFGIFSVVSPNPPVDHEFLAGVQWLSQACGQAVQTTNPCYDSTADPTLHGDMLCSIVGYDPFTVYAFNDDSVGGYGGNLAMMADNARTRLAAGEQEAVEQHLWGLMAAAVTEVSTVAAGTLTYALGWVEQRLAETYGNTGIIHMSRLAATILAAGGGLVRDTGGKLTTVLGTPIVAGGGYDETGGAVPTTGTIYGTGPIVAFRGAVDTGNPVILDRSVNDVSVIAQRDYVLGWDCVAIGATTTLA